MVDLSVTLPGMPLDNPVIPASGTFGYGREFASYYDINILGSFSIKGTTLHPRFGNETPRIAETPSGMLNAVGLQNPGIDHVLACELPELKAFFHKKVIANIGGFSVGEYVECARRAAKADNVGMIELNISCPNVHGGGMGFGTTAESAYEVTRAVRAAVDKPLFVKLTPNVTDIASIAKAVEQAGADGVSLINTLLGMRIDLRTKHHRRAERAGGVPDRAADGLPGLRGRKHPDHRDGRRFERGGCAGNDARGGFGGAGRRGQPRPSDGLPRHHPRPARSGGALRDHLAAQHHRRSAPIRRFPDRNRFITRGNCRRKRYRRAYFSVLCPERHPLLRMKCKKGDKPT